MKVKISFKMVLDHLERIWQFLGRSLRAMLTFLGLPDGGPSTLTPGEKAPTPSAAPSSESPTALKIRSNKYLATAVVTFAICFALDFSTVFEDSKDLSVSWLKILIIINCLGLALVLILINIWSILNIHEYLGVSATKVDLPCDYCGGTPSGPLLCSNCHSILWGRINSTMTDVAVFIAQHRWSIITGVFAIFLISPMSFLYKKIIEKELEKKELIKRSIDHINLRNEFRSEISIYERENNQRKINVDQLNKITTLHTRISWETPRLFEDISRLIGGELKLCEFPKSNSSSFDQARFLYHLIEKGEETYCDSMSNSKELKVEGNPQSRWTNFIRSITKAAQATQDTLAEKELKVEGNPQRRWTNFVRSITKAAQATQDTLAEIEFRKQCAYDLDTEFRVTNAIINEFIKTINHEKTPAEENENLNIFKEIYGKNYKYVLEINVSTYLIQPIKDSFEVHQYPVMIRKYSQQ